VENNVTGDADISLEKIQKAINYTKTINCHRLPSEIFKHGVDAIVS